MRLREFQIEIRRLETGLGEDISQNRRSPNQTRPASARQRNPANLERRVGGTQCDRLSDQAIGAHRVVKFADAQRTPWMRFGKRPLYLPFAIAVEERTTEHKDEYRDGEDDHPKAKADTSPEPPQRKLPAILHRFTSAAQGAAGDREDLTLVVSPAPNRQFPPRALDFDSLPQFARAVGSLLAAAGRRFLDGLFDRFPGFAGALLNAAQQLIGSNPAQQKQDDQDGQNHTQSAGRTIPPIPAVWPGRQCAN